MRPLPIFVSTRVLFKSSIYKSTIVSPVKLQPLHRTKKKTGDAACLFVCLVLVSVVSFFVSLGLRLTKVACNVFASLFFNIRWRSWKLRLSQVARRDIFLFIFNLSMWGVKAYYIFGARLFFCCFKLSMWSVKECYTL